ncbi:tetratricopeptide repeat protein [Streptomyces sp. NRRL S-340]|uniref:tetratricopeptide repeat protein n=1 Tax=Streptomyces sp. NRRL S-340 TaxID=1463901 RepID=UPI0005626B51|nr:tetratricopeptide repeat protein [Streptomyces sp. NRRL S-340]
MAQARHSMQDLIRQRRRAGFVGRGGERAAFRENLGLTPEDERHRFLFHVRGDAGVGKTFLVREMEQIARECGGLTAYVDESVGSVPEAMAEVGRQFASRGWRCKELERLLAAHRDRRHEAEAALAVPQPQPDGPSPASATAMRLGLAGIGLIPGAGPFVGAVDAAQLAQGADRLRAGLSARFRSQDDVQLVLSPEQSLTPVLLGELAEIASQVPWIVLFFDTYEMTAPFLDGWLHDVMATDRYAGSLPANVVVVTAGQRRLDPVRWSDFADFVQDVVLGPFTEAEARGLLAAKGVVAEPVVEEVIRLTGGLPVLVSTLAETRPAGREEVDDPSETAVERFLKWEQDPVRRAAALAGALPRRLDADVFRAAADCPEAEAGPLFTWVRGMPFVSERGDGLRYHDVVRAPMLRLQRRRSPHGWAQRHERLARAFGAWRERAAGDARPGEEWEREAWRELRLEETYHLLCARGTAALGGALRDLVLACREDAAAGRRWARMLQEAGAATGLPVLERWGTRLGEALSDERSGVTEAMDRLLARPALRGRDRAAAHALRGRELKDAGEYRRALAAYDRAVELDPGLAWAHYGRAVTFALMDDHAAALPGLDRADELAPGTPYIIGMRGEILRVLGRFEEALEACDRAVELDPANGAVLATRAACRHRLGQHEAALADYDQALSIDGEYLWALVRRARLRRTLRQPDEAFADLDRAARLAPDSAWVASERGDAYRIAGRFEEAVTELGRAVALDPAHASALASRGAALVELGRAEEALGDLSRAVELDPGYTWALVMRSRARFRLGDRDGRVEDLLRAVGTAPRDVLPRIELAYTYETAGRYDEAVALYEEVLAEHPEDFRALAGLGAARLGRCEHAEALRLLDRALEVAPDYDWAYAQRARVCLATGRTEQALADLDRCLAREPGAVWATWERRTAIEVLMRCGRWEEATARLADAGREAAPDDDGALDRLWAEAHRHAGRQAAARRSAERLRVSDPVAGTLQLALTVGRFEGVPAAGPLWRELARLLRAGGADTAGHRVARCVTACGRGDWAGADRALAGLPAAVPDWYGLAELAAALTVLLHSPGTDRPRLAPRLAAVTTARDAVRARHAG